MVILSFQNEAEFDQVFSDALFKSYVFKMRAKFETYNVSNKSNLCSKLKVVG